MRWARWTPWMFPLTAAATIVWLIATLEPDLDLRAATAAVEDSRTPMKTLGTRSPRMTSTQLDDTVGRTSLGSHPLSPTAPTGAHRAGVASGIAGQPTSVAALLDQLSRAADGGARARLRAEVARRAAAAGADLLAYARSGSHPQGSRREAWDALAAGWGPAALAIESALAGDDRERDPGLVVHLARLLRHGAPERAATAIARTMARESDAGLRDRLASELVLAGPVTDAGVLARGLVDGPPELTRALLRGALSATGPAAGRAAAAACRDALRTCGGEVTPPIRDLLRALAAHDGEEGDADLALERASADPGLAPDVRAAALRARVDGATPEVRARILDELSSEVATLFPQALDELARAGDTSALVRLATQHADALVRARAVAALPPELGRLEDFLADGAPAVRAAALRRLAAVRGEGDEPRRLASQALTSARDDGECLAAAAALDGLLADSGEAATDDELAALYDFACRAQAPAAPARAMVLLIRVGGERARALLEARRAATADAAERDRIDRVLGSIERMVR